MTIDAAWADLQVRSTDMLVVSGGEPMLQQRQLSPLLRLAFDAGWCTEIETAGTIAPQPDVVGLVTRFNVSPKLANSGNELDERYRPSVLEAFQVSGKAAWKFVASSVADLDEIADLVGRHGLRPIYVMPEGTRPDVITKRAQQLAEAVTQRGWNLTTRLHILLYGNRRGV
jgi:organic radical activating enzyme